MSLIVSPLGDVPMVIEARRPSHLVTLLDPGHALEWPESIAPANWLRLSLHDIHFPTAGMMAPTQEAVQQLLAFAETWDQSAPMLIHCHAGISRSTASAYIIACALHPQIDEGAMAAQLREASPQAYPNRALIAHADTLLGRDGRMIAGIEAMSAQDRSWQIPFEFWPIGT